MLTRGFKIMAVHQCISAPPLAHLLILGCEVPCAVGDLCASIFNDLSANRDVCHSVTPAVGVGRLEEREDIGGWGRGSRESIRVIHSEDDTLSYQFRKL